MDLHAALGLGRALLDRHGLPDWHLGLDRAKTRAGVCRADRRTITLSAPLTRLHSPQEVRDTLLHEIAHALVGPGHGHDAVWRARAEAIGGTAARCLSQDAPRVPGPWAGRCPAGHVVRRHRRPARVVWCTRCEGAVADRVLEWTYHGQPVTMPASYERERAALLAGAAERGPSAHAVGDRVQVTAPGRYLGAVGTVLKCGRTRYHLQVTGGVLTVPFALVAPASAEHV